MKLIKISFPGWEKDFDSEEELKAELYENICLLCRMGSIEDFGDGEIYGCDPIDETSSVGEMLGSSCGCEFLVEK